MTPAPSLPAHASVIVIGGGVMGASTLYHLAQMGARDAILLERNRLTSGTTWHSAAQVRALRGSRNLTRMIQYSIDLYGRLEAETGQAVGWIQKGSLSIATCPDRLTHIRRQAALARAFGLAAEELGPAAARERWPMMNGADLLGAVWAPQDGRVSPSDLCAALIKGAKARGARVFEGTGVTGLRTKRGRITGVETTQGPIACEAIALCAGLWSREIGAMAGASVPLWPCEHFYLLTKPIPGISGNLPTLSDHDAHLYIRDDSGGLLVGCFEPNAKAIAPGLLDETFEFGLLPEDWDHFEPMMLNALHRLPALEQAEVKMLLNGPESFTPDGLFMLGEVAETPGLFLGTGMNSVGIASGGGAGMNLAHTILHGRPAYDLSEADAKRFAPHYDRVEALMARAPEVLGNHYEIAYPGRQWASARGLRRLGLDAQHRALGAQMGESYGWERPLYYGPPAVPRFGRPDWHDAVGAEVRAAHQEAALFDNSCFGKIEVEGPDAESFLRHVCAGQIGRAPGRAIYTALLNEQGTYESDLTAQRIGVDHYRLFVGTGAIKRDLAWLRARQSGFDVTLTDSTESYGLFVLAGPQAARIAADLGAPELNDLGYFDVGPAYLAGKHVRAVRLSYVGEAGWELTCKAENGPALFQALLAAGARPAGLYAQTSMRIEKGFAAMGHELDGDISPRAAGLAHLCRAEGYIGAAALAQDQSPRSLVSLILEDPNALPLGHEPVWQGGDITGLTISAAFGHRLGRAVALAHVKNPTDGARVEIDIAGTRHGARLQFATAFDPSGARMRKTAHDRPRK